MTSDRKPVVLLVEDEPFVRFVGRELLEEGGFEVVEAADAGEAEALLAARDDIDLLFTDVHMPGAVDGLALAARARVARPALAVAVTSGRARPRPSDLPVGVAFVAKPYHPARLADQLRALLGR